MRSCEGVCTVHISNTMSTHLLSIPFAADSEFWHRLPSHPTRQVGPSHTKSLVALLRRWHEALIRGRSHSQIGKGGGGGGEGDYRQVPCEYPSFVCRYFK